MNLYLEKCLPHLKAPFVNLNFLHCHPYFWPDGSRYPVIMKNFRTRAHWYFNCGLVLLYSMFVTSRAVQLWLDPAQAVSVKFYMTFATQLYLAFTFGFVTAVTTRNDLVPFLRRYINFLQNCKTVSKQLQQIKIQTNSN